MTEYRNYEIIPDENWGYIFTHKEYTGPPDFIGSGESIKACKEQINERIKES